MNQRIAKYNTDAKKLLARYDDAFTKVQAYQTKRGLSVSGYDGLVATAVTAQTSASGAVVALGTVSVRIDCTSNDPAVALTTVKTAVATAKTALKGYRAAIKAIIQALSAASPTPTPTTTPTPSEGSN